MKIVPHLDCDSAVALPLPLENRLSRHAETTQAAAEDDTGCCAKERRHADRLDILPGNDVTEEFWRNPAAHEAEQSTHHHADERRDCHDGEDLFPGHGVSSPAEARRLTCPKGRCRSRVN